MTCDRRVPPNAAISEPRSPVRRVLLRAGLATGLGLVVPASAYPEEEKPGSDERPKPGDLLVYAEDDHAGQVIKPADLVAGGPLTQAFAMDPQTKVVRDGSRLNYLVLLRLDPQGLDEETRPASVDGIVAYSAICTHAGCPVTGFLEEQGRPVLKCFCHNSVFDPHQQGTVVSGPAPNHLAILPLKVAADALVVARKFIGRVGPTQSG
jgi:rieske iron-sulfur protein